MSRCVIHSVNCKLVQHLTGAAVFENVRKVQLVLPGDVKPLGYN